MRGAIARPQDPLVQLVEVVAALVIRGMAGQEETREGVTGQQDLVVAVVGGMVAVIVPPTNLQEEEAGLEF